MRTEEVTATGFADRDTGSLSTTSLRDSDGLADGGFSILARQSSVLQLIAVDPTQTDFVMRGMMASRTGFEKIQTRTLVGLMLDDAPIALSGYNPNFRLVDMQSVEIQPGPQSVRYGQTAAAGMVRLATVPVDLDRSAATASLEGGSIEGGGLNGGVSGVANLVLSAGKAGLRLVAYDQHDGGFLDNDVLKRTNTNVADTIGGRAKFTVQFDPQTSFTLAGAYQDIEEKDGFAAAQTAGITRRNSLRLEPAFARNGVVSGTFARTADLLDVSATLSGIFARNGVAPEIGGETEFFAHLVNPAVAVPTYDTPLKTRTGSDGFAGEVRLQSHDRGWFHWLAGVSVSEDRRGIVQNIDAPGFDALTGVNSTVFGVPADRLAQINLSYLTHETALFGEIAVQLSDEVQAVAGVRAFDARVSGAFDFRGLGEGGIQQASPRQHSDGTVPQFTLNYRPDSNSLFYARIAKGYRLGGINTFVSPVVCAADLAALGLTAAKPVFQPDAVWSYEAGSKAVFADGRASLEATAFTMDWNDVQTLTQLKCGFNTVLNGGHLGSKGVELNADLKPVEGLDVSASLTYTHSRFGAGSPAPGTPAGTQAPLAPEWAALAGARYDMRLLGYASFATATYRYTGARFDDPDVTVRQVMPAYGEVDLRAGVRIEQWAVSAFVDNLANGAGVLSQTDFPFSHFPGRRITTLRPRTVGFAASRSF